MLRQQERAEWYRRARQRATVQRCCLRQGIITSLLIRCTVNSLLFLVMFPKKQKLPSAVCSFLQFPGRGVGWKMEPSLIAQNQVPMINFKSERSSEIENSNILDWVIRRCCLLSDLHVLQLHNRMPWEGHHALRQVCQGKCSNLLPVGNKQNFNCWQ